MNKVIFKTKTQKHNDFQKELKRTMKEAGILPHGNIDIVHMEDGSVVIRNADAPFQFPLEQKETKSPATHKFVLQDDYNDNEPKYLELNKEQEDMFNWLKENDYINNATLVDLDTIEFEKI